MLLVSYSVLQTVTYTLLARSASIIVKIMMIRMIMMATIMMIRMINDHDGNNCDDLDHGGNDCDDLDYAGPQGVAHPNQEFSKGFITM